MIKIELDRDGPSALRTALLVLLAVAVAGSTFVAARSLLAGSDSSPVRLLLESFTSSEEVVPEDPVVVEGEPQPAPASAPAAAQPANRRRRNEPPAYRRADLHHTLVCSRALELRHKLPPTMRFTSLSGKWTGEYTIEGMSTTTEVAILFDFLETLKKLPSTVSLSYWREGNVGDSRFYKFTFRGRFDDISDEALTPLDKGTAAKLLADFVNQAKHKGLTSVSAKDPIAVPLAEGTQRQRLKIWGNGSYSLIANYVKSVSENRGAVIGELVVVPDSGAGTGQLYAAIDVAVQHPSETGH